MAYTPYSPTTWAIGSTVTPAALNKIEQGLVDAEKATVNLLESSASEKKNYNIISAYSVSESKKYAVYANSNMQMYYRTGSTGSTAADDGYITMRLGNGTAMGTEGNAYGNILLYGHNTKYCQISDSHDAPLTANRNLYIPDKNGTIAITDDIPIFEQVTVTQPASSATAEFTLSNGYKSGSIVATQIRTSSSVASVLAFSLTETNPSTGVATFRTSTSSSTGRTFVINVMYKKA